jgi:LysM repeat protein
MDWNNLITTKLSVGKKLLVYAPKENLSNSEVTAAPLMPRDKQKNQVKKTTTSLPASGIYKVKNGDSLWLIAKKFGTSIEFLRKINHLKSDKLHLGQSLKIKN